MNTIKDILIIVFLIPQLTEAIYRVYNGDMEDRKVIFYLCVTCLSHLLVIFILFILRIKQIKSSIWGQKRKELSF